MDCWQWHEQQVFCYGKKKPMGEIFQCDFRKRRGANLMRLSTQKTVLTWPIGSLPADTPIAQWLDQTPHKPQWQRWPSSTWLGQPQGSCQPEETPGHLELASQVSGGFWRLENKSYPGEKTTRSIAIFSKLMILQSTIWVSCYTAFRKVNTIKTWCTRFQKEGSEGTLKSLLGHPSFASLIL